MSCRLFARFVGKREIGIFLLAAALRWLAVAVIAVTTLSVLVVGAASSWQMPSSVPPGHFPFCSYGVNKGLSNLSIWALAQDRDGFIWVGTEDGLFRYDGNRFWRFGVENGLPSAHVAVLLADKEKGVWAGTYGGLVYFDGRDFLTPPPDAHLPSTEVRSLALDKHGRLWVALKGGLFQGDFRTGFQLAPGWPGGEAYAVFIDSARGDEVYASLGDRIGCLVPGSSWTVGVIGEGLGSERIGGLAVDAGGRLWVRSPAHLFVKEMGASTFRDESQRIPAGSGGSYLCLDQSRNVWVPINTGLLHHQDGTWTVIGRNQGMPADWSRAILEDREGSLWVASLGVYRLIGRGAWLAWTSQEGLPSDTIWCIFRARDGRLYVGTDRGLAVSSAQGWRVFKASAERTIRSVAESNDGWLWMGGIPGEIIRWDPRRDRMERFGVAAGLTGERIMCIHCDRHGDLWVAAEGGGLLRWVPQGESGNFQRVEIPGGSRQERFSSILEDRQGRLLIMSDKGLMVRQGGGWHRFTTRDGLARDYVSWGVETTNGDIWIAYFEPLGIVRLRLEDDRLRVIQHLDNKSGLSSNKVYFLGRDSLDRLWIGLGNGLDLLGPSGITHIDVGDGLAGQDCDSMAFHAEDDGNVFIGTSSGLSLHRSEQEPVQASPPPARIMTARLGNRSLRLNESSITVDSDQNTLEVRFAGLSFLNEDRVRHEVRLVGLEDAWRTTDVREARYTALAPGNYRFEVRARQGNGPYGEPAGISFVVRPPWWQTWPARLGFVLGLLTLVAGGFRYRMRRLEQRTRELESLVTTRTRDLAEANESLARLSVTDPLTGLKNRRYLYLSMSEDIAQWKRIHHDFKAGRQVPAEARADIVFQMVDLDHFKQVNDNYGHAAGDRVLLQMRDILTRATRGTDTVVRWGGEEFLVVARSTMRSEAGRLAERLRNAVKEHRFDIGEGRVVSLTCSVGFAPFPVLAEDPDRVSWEETVELADEALYTAKRSGRDAWVGLVASGAPLPDNLITRVRTEALALLAAGVFIVETSLGGPAQLQWA